MKEYKPNDLVWLWNSIFKKRGGAGKYTKPYSEIDSKAQEFITSHIKFMDTEIPVIISFNNPEQWMLLTTKRIIFGNGAKITSVQNSSICNVKPSQMRSKLPTQWNELSLETKDGIQYKIVIEEGRPFSSIWNVIRNIVDRNC